LVYHKILRFPLEMQKVTSKNILRSIQMFSCGWSVLLILCKKNGYVEIFWGRRRYVPGIYEKNKTLYDLVKRVAINTVAQGTAADIMKIGMIRVHELFHAKKLDAGIVLQIHDELLITVSQKHASYVETLVKSTLEQVVSWSIPLVITTRSGYSWKEVSK